MKVLVTDGANRVALAVVRALGRAGAEVAVVEQELDLHRLRTRRTVSWVAAAPSIPSSPASRSAFSTTKRSLP